MAGELRKEDIIQEEQIVQAMANIAKSVQPVIEGFKKVADEGQRIAKSVGGAQALKELISISKQASKNTEVLSAAQKEQIRIEKQLQSTIAKTNALRTEQGKRLIEEKVKLQEATRAAKEQALSNQKIDTSNRGLNGSFKNLIVSLRDYLTLYIGLSKGIEIIKSVYNLTKALDSLDFSFKKIIPDQVEYAQTQLYLIKLAQDYGADLLTVSERYLKFRAAAQQVNLTASTTQKIFDSVTKASGVLGLKTDELRGIYLALEQMLSKGKVTTEELRRQLGERLPGAFGIMADALNVTIPQLDKMLKAGTILSSEVLPKFAIELEKAYGIESVTKINTLAAAQGRLSTSWLQFVKSLESSSSFISIINKLTDQLYDLRLTFQASSREAENFYNIWTARTNDQAIAFQKMISQYDKISAAHLKNMKSFFVDEVDKMGFLKSQAETLFEEYYKRRLSAAENDKWLKMSIDDLEKYKQAIYDKMISTDPNFVEPTKKEMEQFIAEIERANKRIQEIQITQLFDPAKFKTNLENAQKDYDGFAKLISDTAKEEAIAQSEYLQSGAKSYKQYLDDLLVKYKDNAQARILIEQQIFDYNNSHKKDKADQNAQFKLEAQIQKDIEKEILDDQKAAAKEEINISKDIANSKIEISKKIYDETYDDIVKEQTAKIKAAGQEIKNAKGDAEKIKTIEQNLALALIKIEEDRIKNTLDRNDLEVTERERLKNRLLDLEKEYASKELDNAKETEAKKADVKQQILDKSVELINAGFEALKSSYANQLSAVEAEYAFESKIAGDSADKKILAERKYDKEKTKILKRQAAAEKAQGAFNIVISTAEAIVNALKDFPGPLGFVLAGIIGALGAVQLATVLAQPIPQFAKGVKEGAPETFIAGEKGSEAIIKPSGDVVMTPDKPTLFSDKSFIGSTILPHDQTQRWLANYAVNQTYDMIDMSESNKHLKKIAKNSSQGDSVTIEGNKKIVKRGNITTVYAIS